MASSFKLYKEGCFFLFLQSYKRRKAWQLMLQHVQEQYASDLLDIIGTASNRTNHCMMNLPFASSLWMAALSIAEPTLLGRMSLSKHSLALDTSKAIRGRRMLHNQRAHFNVQLFLDLQFVDESLALDFETMDGANSNIMHFCKSVQTQVR